MGKGEVTRQAILERATALASRCGLEGVSIGHLAEDLGLSKSGLFAHFGAKETLQVEVLRFAADRFVQAVVRPALAEPRGEPRVRAIFERWLGWSDFPGLDVFTVAVTPEEAARVGAIQARGERVYPILRKPGFDLPPEAEPLEAPR